MERARKALALFFLLLLAACDGETASTGPERPTPQEETRGSSAAVRDLRQKVHSLRRKATALRRKIGSRPPSLDRGGPTIGGQLLGLPLVGLVTSRCNDQLEVALGFRPAGASITLRYRGAGVRDKALVHSGKEYVTPFLGASEKHVLDLEYRHKRGLIRTRIRARPESTRFSCVVGDLDVQQKARTFDVVE